MQTDKYILFQLLDKYLSGKANREEQLLIEEYYNRMSRDSESVSDFSVDEEEVIKENIHQNILQFIHGSTSVKRLRIWQKPFFKYAAAILVAVISISLFLYTSNRQSTEESFLGLIDNEIVPGSNRAILELADGRIINLDDASVGEIADASGTKIIKTADGQLIYKLSESDGLANEKVAFNTITTPRAGQYQVILPDGTHVWLNAESSIKYPSRFSKKERQVEITGEAYFEVAHDKQRPFFVKSEHQIIEVLGTHFNVNAYSDEGSTNTTLVEGSVKVYVNDVQSTVLKPNQQAVLNNSNELAVIPVQSEDVMAWKNGRFVFNNTDIQTVMRSVARWYDIEVEYVNGVPNKTVGGDISKFENITQLLEVLEVTCDIQFKRKGRRVLVIAK